jgi:HEAT repeats
MSHELESYIRSNLDELDRKKPDDAVLSRVLDEMKSKKNKRPAGIVLSFRFVKWAAACLLVTACGIALWHFMRQQPAPHVDITHIPEKKQPLAPLNTDPEECATVDALDKRIPIHEKAVVRKVKKKKAVLLAGLNNMQSAASRISAIASTSKMKNNGNDVVDVLVQTLNNDPNANVRLAALDGLTRFHSKTYVRRELVASLNKQQDPLVMINLIDLLTWMRELSILSDLERIVNDENTSKVVKDIAWSGILRLSPRTIN